MITKPPELAEAQLILGLARAFRVPPHEVYTWPARTLQLLAIEQMGGGPETPEGGDLD